MSEPKKLGDILTESLEAIYEQSMVKRIQNSWPLIDKFERKARLSAVMKLSAELEKVKKHTIQATSLAEGVIEDIIEGEWESAAQMIEHFTFKEEHESMRSAYAVVYEDFVTTGRTVCAEHARQTPGERLKSH